MHDVQNGFPSTKLSPKKYWQVAFDKMTLWDKDVTPALKDSIIDSGTSLILADEASVEAFYGNVYGSQFDNETGLWEGESLRLAYSCYS